MQTGRAGEEASLAFVNASRMSGREPTLYLFGSTLAHRDEALFHNDARLSLWLGGIDTIQRFEFLFDPLVQSL